MAETTVSQPFGNGLAPQSTIAGQVAPVCWIGTGLKPAKDGCYFPIAGTAADLIGDGERGIDGHQSRHTAWDRAVDKVQYLVVIAQSGSGAQQPTVCRQDSAP